MSGFPEARTEEEKYLLERYKILREKKRALQKLKERSDIKVKPAVKREAQDTSKTPEDAKKKAEMLVASGCVKIAKASVDREFKRARTSEKKLSREPSSEQETPASADKRVLSKTAMKEMYSSSFVRGGRNESETDSSYTYRGYREPRRGNTIFVRGYGLKEEIVKTAFNKFGTVIDARYEKERNHGFVTFKACEEAEKAIDEMNGTMVSGIHIEVSLARKQLHMESARGNQPMWGSRDFHPRIRREKSTDSRELVSYDEEDFF